MRQQKKCTIVVAHSHKLTDLTRSFFLLALWYRLFYKVRISEVLKAKHSHRWVDPVISRYATVREALVTTIEGGLSGMMVLDGNHNNNNSHAKTITGATSGESSTSTTKNHVVGLLTSRDLLRIMASGVKEGETADNIMNRVIGDYMTPISQVIYARPDETVGMCRAIMAKLGIKCLPILSREGRVEGLITARDMSDFGLSAIERGGKKSYLTDVSTRVGLSSNTRCVTFMDVFVAVAD